MTKRELIEALEALDLPDDTRVVSYHGESWTDATKIDTHYVEQASNVFYSSLDKPLDLMTSPRIEII